MDMLSGEEPSSATSACCGLHKAPSRPTQIPSPRSVHVTPLKPLGTWISRARLVHMHAGRVLSVGGAFETWGKPLAVHPPAPARGGVLSVATRLQPPPRRTAPLPTLIAPHGRHACHVSMGTGERRRACPCPQSQRCQPARLNTSSCAVSARSQAEPVWRGGSMRSAGGRQPPAISRGRRTPSMPSRQLGRRKSTASHLQELSRPASCVCRHAQSSPQLPPHLPAQNRLLLGRPSVTGGGWCLHCTHLAPDSPLTR